MEKQEYRYPGYETVEKIVSNGGNSARVFVPKAWAGKRVRIILLDPIEDK
jgi:putative transposon-encoded protein